MTTTINFIGAGKLGKTIARLIFMHNVGKIQGIHNRSLESTEQAVRFIGAGTPIAHLRDLPPADITFITVPDDEIKHACLSFLNENTQSPKDRILVHCSGSRSSNELLAGKNIGYRIVSAHPIRSFADPGISVSEYPGTYCAIEGDTSAVETLRELFSKIGSIPIEIQENQKKLYHAALTVASNYLVGSSEISINLLERSGLPHDQAVDLSLSLMEGTMKNLLATRSPKESLTGPIKRGDIATLQAHLDAIKDPRINKLYRLFGLSVLELTDHNELLHKQIHDVLSKE